MNEKKGNFSYYFYVDYFLGINYKAIENDRQNVKLLNRKTQELIDFVFNSKPQKIGNVNFEMKTKAPGLIAGIGYPHSIDKIKGGLKFGFSLDYTTGIPYIPGSSIKGVVRDVLGIDDDERIQRLRQEIKKHPEKKEENELMIENINRMKPQKEAFLKKITGEKFEDIKKELFSEDVFLDAFLVAENEKIFDDDFITPHRELFKNPVPIRFLKIKKDVRFLFNFDFNKNARLKEKLIKEILKNIGVGAKTNMGYGRFEEV